MGKLLETKITRFDGGITNDPRDTTDNVFRMIANFDVLTHPHKLIPYRESENGQDTADTTAREQQNFAIGLRSGSYVLYALGELNSSTTAEVNYKALTTGAATDLDDDDWASPSSGDQSGGAGMYDLFVWYHKTLKFYAARSSQYIWTHAPPNTSNTTEQDLTSITNLAQGLVHSQDDILYVPYDNKVARNNNGSWTTAAATIPSHFYITSICEYGNYIAIAAAPLSGIGNSRVFLWNRDSGVTTFDESIDWGVGVLKVLDTIDGILVGISLHGDITPVFNERVYFRAYTGPGNTVQTFKVLDIDAGGFSGLPIAKQKIDNRLYFLMNLTIDGIQRAGLWSLGRSSPGAPFSLIFERTFNNDATLSSGTLKNFIIVGDYVFIAYIDSAGDYQVKKTTDDSTGYSATSYAETKIYNAGDSSLKKDLLGVTVMTEAMPANGQVVLKYQKDDAIGGGTWTTIFTNTTDDSISYSVSKQSGLLPGDYKEIAFRVESVGGAVITGLTFQEEITGKRVYA